MEETIILAVDIETKQAQTQLDLLAKNIEDAQKRQDELNKQFKEGAITLEEYNKGTKENTKEIKASETATKNLTTAVKAEENSITALSQKNKELIKERNSINTSTVEGANRIKEINKQIDENNDKIKANVSGLEKQRLNIGNYASALEGIGGSLKSVVPGLGGMTNGISGITAGAKAFTATPFGATLQIIAGLLSVLIESFKGSEEGQRNLNKITQVTTALFGALGELLRDLGGLLIDAFKNPKQALMDLADFVKENLINRFKAFGVILDGIINLDFKKVSNGVLQFGSGVENVIGKIENVGKAVTDVANKALEQGNKVAKLQAEIEDLEDEANLRRAQNEIKIAKLREDAIKQEGDAKRKSIEEAIALEKQSADFSIQIAQKKVELAKAELATSTNKKEATDKLEDAEVNLANAQAERYQATLRFEKQLEGVRDAQIKQEEKRLEIIQKIAAEEQKQQEEQDALFQKLQEDADARIDLALKTGLEELEIDRQNKEAFAKQQKDFDFKQEQERKALIQQQKLDDQLLYKQKLDIINQTALLASAVFKKSKEVQIASTLISTFSAAQDAFKAGMSVGGPLAPVLATLYAANAVAQGLARVAAIKSVSEGGSSVSSGSRSSGVVSTQATTNPINERFNLSNNNQGMTVVASWKEATEVRNRVEFKESLITV